MDTDTIVIGQTHREETIPKLILKYKKHFPELNTSLEMFIEILKGRGWSMEDVNAVETYIKQYLSMSRQFRRIKRKINNSDACPKCWQKTIVINRTTRVHSCDNCGWVGWNPNKK